MTAGKDRSRLTRAVKKRMARILSTLQHAMPHAHVELDHHNAFQLLVATILSAQCTDQRVNQVTRTLFRRYQHPIEYAKADTRDLEVSILPTGFYKSKARNLIGTGQMLVDRFGGKVPATMEELVSLPGVGRKTANVLLGNCFGQPAVVVDTHVKRVAQRLGLTGSKDADVIEQELQRLIPVNQWTAGSQLLLWHGRYVCVAKRPKCEQCPIYTECLWEGKRSR